MQRAHHSMGHRRQDDIPIQVSYTDEDVKSEKKYKARKRLYKIKIFVAVIAVLGFFAVGLYVLPSGSSETEDELLKHVVRDKVEYAPKEVEETKPKVEFLPRNVEEKELVPGEEELEEKQEELDEDVSEMDKKEGDVEEKVPEVDEKQQETEDKQVPGLRVLAEAGEEFAFDLYHSLSKTYEGRNVIFSPLSLTTALAMTYLGARGQSATQMEKVLKFDKDGLQEVHPIFHMLNSELFNVDSGYILNSANKLFGEKNYTFLSEFLSSAEAYYGSALEQMDFHGNPEGARGDINSWVERKTEEKIKDLIPLGAVDRLTRLILVNALYFKGKWAQQFDAKLTKIDNFYLDERNTKKIPMMSIRGHEFKYFEDKVLKCQILEMPYSASNLSMTVILPSERNGLVSLQRNLTADILRKWHSNLHMMKVDVTLPRFKTDSSFQLKPELQKLGMTDLFVPGLADLTGMADDRQLYVHDAVHKAFVEVTEEGTEAAAASAVMVGITSVQITPRFTVNHPFIFLIRDNNIGTLLFLGKIIDPS